LLRAFARARDPGEARFAVDEALDQPGAREAVDPRRLACCPEPLAVAAVLHLAQRSLRKARLAAAVHLLVERFQVAQCRGRLGLRLAGEKVDPRQLLQRPLEAPVCRLRSALP